MFISSELSRICSTKWDILSQGQFVQGQSETNALLCDDEGNPEEHPGSKAQYSQQCRVVQWTLLLNARDSYEGDYSVLVINNCALYFRLWNI